MIDIFSSELESVENGNVDGGQVFQVATEPGLRLLFFGHRQFLTRIRVREQATKCPCLYGFGPGRVSSAAQPRVAVLRVH
jgi:hypothetical protein